MKQTKYKVFAYSTNGDRYITARHSFLSAWWAVVSTPLFGFRIHFSNGTSEIIGGRHIRNFVIEQQAV